MSANPVPPADAIVLEPAVSAASLLDPGALVIVLAGTLIATLAQAGWADTAHALRSLGALTHSGLDEAANRAALARWVRAVRKSGILAADEPLPPDPALAFALDGLVRSGSIAALHSLNDTARDRRIAARSRAAMVFEQAGDLAPVFGLVGTLFALTRFAPGAVGEQDAAAFGAIATAVLSSLYGVLTAHLVCFPLAGALIRRGRHEDEARDALTDWVAHEIADALPSSASAPKGASRESPQIASLKAGLKTVPKPALKPVA